MDLKFIVKPVLAQIGRPIGDFEVIGNIGLEGGGAAGAAGLLNTIISNLLGLLTIIAGIWFLIQIILAGYSFINAQGDQQKVDNARRQITNAIIGVVIVVGAIFFLSLIGELLDVKFLNIVEQINNLAI